MSDRRCRLCRHARGYRGPRPGGDVALISKIHPCAAIRAPLRAGSTPRSATPPRTTREHASTRSRGSDYLGDQDAIRCSATGRPATSTNSALGRGVSRTEDGGSRSAVRRRRRAAYRLRADITGHVLVHVPRAGDEARPQVYEEYFARQLVEHENRCQGVICWDLLNGAAIDRRRP